MKHTIRQVLLSIGLFLGLVLLPACEQPPAKVFQMDAAPEVEPYLVLDPLDPPQEAPQWIVITPFDAAPALAELLYHRDSQDMNPKVIPVEYIYSAYGDGSRRWESISKFLNHWRRHYKDRMPKFVVLAGSADPLNFEQLYIPPVRTFRPSLTSNFGDYEPHPSEPNFLISDYPYSVAAGQSRPDLTIGRLPARSKRGLREIAEKIANYETRREPGAWMREIRVLGGFTQTERPDLPWSDWRSWISPAYLLDYTNFQIDDAFGKPLSMAPFEWNQAMLSGPALFVYFGPGYQDSIGPVYDKDQPVLLLDTRGAVDSINPAQRTTVVALASWTARFDGTTPSIGELLLNQPNGPALYIGATRRTLPYVNLRVAAALHQALGTEDYQRIGEWFLQAQQLLAEQKVMPFENPISLPEKTTDAQRRQLDREALWIYTLLGDPASPLGLATARFTLQTPSTARLDEKITIRYKGPEKSGRLRITLSTPHDRLIDPDDIFMILPNQGPRALIRRHRLANNNTLLQQGRLLDAKGASWSFHIPEDIEPGLYYITAWGNFIGEQAIAQHPIMILSGESPSTTTQPDPELHETEKD